MIKPDIKIEYSDKFGYSVLTSCGTYFFLQKKHALFFKKMRGKQFKTLFALCLKSHQDIIKDSSYWLDSAYSLRTLSRHLDSFSRSVFALSNFDYLQYWQKEKYVLYMLSDMMRTCEDLGNVKKFNFLTSFYTSFVSARYVDFVDRIEKN